MQFSVIITAYERLSLLKRAVNSALQQTIDCEVIIVDDASSADTSAYIQELNNERIIYHRNPVNQGHAAIANIGISKANGDWIKFLDDDDYLAPNCLEGIAKAIAAHPQAVICSCIAAQVDSRGVELSRTPRVGPGLAYYIPQADIHYGMLLELVPFGTTVQVACRRDALLQSGGWDSQFELDCDDIDLWIRVAQFGDAIFLNQCLVYRTIWTGAYNSRISLIQRMNTNILMKQKIHALIHHKYQTKIPDLLDVNKYVTLHWMGVAIKQKRFKSLLNMLNSAIISPGAWRILLTAIASRYSLRIGDFVDIRKVPLS